MKNNQSGQSTIEFIFTFATGVSIILLVFNSAMNYTTGYLVHYATFMASRTYLTQDTFAGNFGSSQASLGNAEQIAREVFKTYNLDMFDINSTSLSIFPAGNTPGGKYLSVGAMTSYSKSIDAIGKITGQTKLNLVSESFLGKEPTRQVCATRVCEAITGRPNCSIQLDITLFDDGC